MRSIALPFVALLLVILCAESGCTAILAQSAGGGAPDETIRLELGKPIEREMRGGEMHSYKIHAEPGQFVHVVVLQEGIDVAVSLLDPQGEELAMTDSANGMYGPEPVSAIAEGPGDYQVRIVASSAFSGRYRVTVTDQRLPTDLDRTRVRAERAYMEGATLYMHGDSLSSEAAAQKWRQSTLLWRSIGDKYGQAISSLSLAAALQGNEEALESFNQALTLFRAVGDQDGEAVALTGIGKLYFDRGETQKGLEDLNQALTIFRAVADPVNEAGALNQISSVYSLLGETPKALECLEEALKLIRAFDPTAGEPTLLNNIGALYGRQGEYQKASEYFNQALVKSRAEDDRGGEALALYGIGFSYSHWGEEQKALENLNQALTTFRALGDQTHEAAALVIIGDCYRHLGDDQQALGYYNQARPIFRAADDRWAEAASLVAIGLVRNQMGEHQKALEIFDQALPIIRAVGARREEAQALDGIGLVYLDEGDEGNALEYLSRSLTIFRAIGERAGEAAMLRMVGRVYSELGDHQNALKYSNQALAVATAVREPLLESQILHQLMSIEHQQHPALAIFYGKQAVNLLQQVRGNIQSLDKELQSKFLASKSDAYRGLADLLIAQGRLPEAEQVLDLLKRQEFSDYVRGDPAKILGPVSLTPAEQQAEVDYQKSTAQLVTENERWDALKKNKSRTPQEEAEFQQLSTALDQAGKGLEAYYSRLYKLFGEGSAANREKADVHGNVTNLNQLVKNSPGVVALYTTVTSERISVIVIAGSAIVARESSIAGTDLNKKIADFQLLLRSPYNDPKRLAQELYKILVAPVKTDLDQAKAETLVWSLDGVLRYIPIAALYDGNHYLVENYNIVTFTPASIPYLSQKPEMDHVSAVAMGISRQYEEALKPLPAVVGELEDIVKDPQLPDANGVLPGSILLDGQFTEKAMEGQLDSSHSIVHIASHFVFKPGDDNASYLLLAGKDAAGAGYHLTVRDFNSNRNLSLDTTDLLTLSACETGMSGTSGNGEEIDGLSAVAQNKGAKAVISSLWEVNDASTGQLMADFYKRWTDGAGKVMKAEALRQAQLDLLRGTVAPRTAANSRGIKVDEPEPASHDHPTSYTHPYYWAPFVLTGNWR